LFQLWVNLPAEQKFDPPHIQYVGDTTDHPWVEHYSDGVKVRDIGATLDASLLMQNEKAKEPVVNNRPPVSVLHVTMQPGSQWETPAPREHSALLYVREGTATLPSLDKSQSEQTANALQTAPFRANGDSIVVRNARLRPLDFLLLTAAPLREPVALGGPIVMNSEEELNDAFRQLSDGTFLKRDLALRQQADTLRRTGRMV
jgi:redox-sensitive bicupin YhaK (pirin superfamily)